MFWYNTFAALGLVAVVGLLFWQCRRAGVSAGHALAIPLLLFLVTRIGAGVLYSVETGEWAEHVYEYADLTRPGLSYYGGFLLGIAFLIAYGVVSRLGVIRILDLLAAPAAIGYAVGRLGCLFSGCCRGVLLPREWWLPEAFPLPHLFPAPLLSATVHLTIGLILLFIPTELRGWRSIWFLVLAAAARLGVEQVRTNQDVWMGLTQVELISIVVGILGLSLFLYRRFSPSSAATR